MLDVLEVILFYVATFGAFYGVGGFISDLLDKVGVWPMEKDAAPLTQEPRSGAESEAGQKPKMDIFTHKLYQNKP